MDYKVIYQDMPTRIKAFTKKDGDFYTIVLNSRLSRQQQEKSFDHEYAHIQGNDFSGTSADAIETERH